MLLRKDTLEGIARGEIDVAFRWWTKPTVKAGGFLQTAVGRLAIVQADRPFCTFGDDVFTLEVAARQGSGRFAAEVWSLGEPRRKGERAAGPADEGPIDKP